MARGSIRTGFHQSAARGKKPPKRVAGDFEVRVHNWRTPMTKIPRSQDVSSAGNAPVGAGRFKLFCFHRCGLALSLSLASAIFLCGCHKKPLAASQAPEPVSAPAAAPHAPPEM